MHDVNLFDNTRMHSSRMRTVHSSSRLLEGEGVPGPEGMYLVRRGVLGPRGVYLVLGSVPGPGEYTWSQVVYLVWRGVYLVLGGVPGPRGCTWSWGVYLVLGLYLIQGVYLVPGGVSGPREGVYLVSERGCTWSQGGVPGPGWCTWSQEGGCTWSLGGTCPGTPPCGQTHTCKNITFATLLRTVTRKYSSRIHTARLETIRAIHVSVSVAIARCRSCGSGYVLK